MIPLLFFSQYINCKSHDMCIVNVSGYQYDLSTLSDAFGVQDYLIDNRRLVRYRVCDAMKEGDYKHKYQFQNGIQSMVINDSEISFLGLLISQDAKKKTTNSNKNSIQLNYYWNEGNFTFNNLINIVIDPSVTNFKINNTNFIERKYITTFSVEITTSLVQVQAYEYTPREENNLLRCAYKTANSSKGIEINLRNYSINKNGFATKLGNGLDLLMQPCELITCPSGFDCDSKESLIWACDSSSFKCKSYSNNTVTFNESSTFQVSYGNYNNRMATIEYECDNLAPWPYYTDYMISDTELHIFGKMSGVCTKELRSKNIEMERNDHFLSFNIENSNYVGPDIINLENEYKLYYKFGKSINCPKGFYCEDTQSAAYACKDIFCRTLASDHTPYSTTPSHKRYLDSFSIDYHSDAGSLTTNVVCNRSCAKNQFIFDNASYDEKTNHGIIFVQNSNVCDWEWILSEFPNEDIPPPPSKISRLVYHGNTTHSIKIDLTALYLAETLWATTSESGTMDMTTILMPGSPIPCHKTQNGDNYTSDGCFCWRNKDGVDVCHASALSGYKPDSNLIVDSDLQSGVSVTFRGAGYVRTKVNFFCSDYYREPSYVTYIEPNQFILAWSHKDACPKQEILPHVPPNPAHTPEPPSENVSVIVNINGKSLNLENITGRESVVLDVGGTVEQADIIYSLGSTLDCPNNARCYSPKASIWKCWASNIDPYICVALADARYGFKARKDEIEYSGGYGGYITTIDFQCEKDLKAPKMSGNGSEYSMRVSLSVSSSDFCQVDYDNEDDEFDVPISVIFLVSLATILVLYLGVGTGINYTRWHRCEIPNSRFWVEFGLCVVDGWKFITCRYQRNERESSIPDAELI